MRQPIKTTAPALVRPDAAEGTPLGTAARGRTKCGGDRSPRTRRAGAGAWLWARATG